jgi:hypothetical protein
MGYEYHACRSPCKPVRPRKRLQIGAPCIVQKLNFTTDDTDNTDLHDQEVQMLNRIIFGVSPCDLCSSVVRFVFSQFLHRPALMRARH